MLPNVVSGFVSEAIEKRMQYLVLETVAGEGRDDLMACLLGEFLKAITHDVEANSVIEQSHHRFLVLGHANGLMERDGSQTSCWTLWRDHVVQASYGPHWLHLPRSVCPRYCNAW